MATQAKQPPDGLPDELRQVLQTVDDLRGLSARDPALLPRLAATLDAAGMGLWTQGYPKEGLEKLKEAQELYRRLAASEAFLLPLVRSLGASGSMRAQAGDAAGALAAFHEAIRLLLPLARHSPATHQALLSSLVRDTMSTARAGKLRVDSEQIAEALRLL